MEKEKQLTKRFSKKTQKDLAKEEPKITKIVSPTNKAYESFNVDIIYDKDPQVQLRQSKELTKDFLIGELNKRYGKKSLSDLADDLPKDSFYHTKKEFGTENLELITRKGVYPYDYMNDFNKFKKEGLPSIEIFYSKLIGEYISDCDYNHAENVWKKNECKTIGDKHDLYLKSDVLILADVFENFRKTGKEYYNLDPAHYFSCPGFAWDAMLKMTDINLKLITDIDMYQMVEKGLRGGVSYIANRYSKPNYVLRRK